MKPEARVFEIVLKKKLKLLDENFSPNRSKKPGNTSNISKAIHDIIPKQCTSQRTFSKDSKTVADEFHRFFVSVGQSSVDKILSLANECNITLNRNYFVQRKYP